MKLIKIFLPITLFVSILLPYLGFSQDMDIETRPLFEAGIGMGGGYLPDYPASDQSHVRSIPFPYFIYRGDFLRSDRRKGTRAYFFGNRDIEVDLSGAGSFPAESADNNARRGMPDLDWIGEIGPRLFINLAEIESHWHLTARIPVRAVFSTNISTIDHQGYSFTPSVVLEKFGLLHVRSRLAFSLTLNFMDQKLAQYFYDVKPQYVTADRASYDSRAGYLGTDLSISFSHPIKNYFRAFTSFELSNYDGSVNRLSPLSRSIWNQSISAGFILVLYESEAKARHSEKTD